MSFGSRVRKGLDFVRLSLGGAMLGACGANVFGQLMSFDPSMKRDLICAAVGFALFSCILIDEHRKETQAAGEASKKLDAATLPADNH